MASRMERYYRQNNSRSKRSDRNQNLYRDIYDSASYSNIEGIATIEKSNEIDITKVKKMLQNREEYKRQKEVNRIISKKEPEINVPPLQVNDLDHTRNYDIRDILNKAKDNKKIPNDYHSIDNTNYNILKKLKDKKDLFNDNTSEEELQDLINTITSSSMINELDDQQLSLDLLDDLKSENDTLIQDKSSIKNILEEVKNEEKKNQFDSTGELDKSFFSSSLSFGEDDFGKIADLNSNLMKNNILLKLLVLIVLVVITAGIIFLVYNLVK